MIEKRFFMRSYSIWDSQNDNRRVSIETACKLLNELNEENENLKNALWEAEEEYIYEAYRDNPIRLQDKIMDLKMDWDKEYWNDS